MLNSKVTLNHPFSKGFSGIIWKIEPDFNGTKVALELRDPTQKQVSFSIIDLDTNEVSAENIQVEERWYFGIETFYQDLLYLHGYTNESLPEHKGIIAFDTKGKKVWENYQLTYYQISIEGIIAYNSKIEPRRYVLLDRSSGEQTQQSISPIGQKDNLIAEHHELDFPQKISAANLQLPVNLGKADEVEILEKNGKTIISWYQNSGNMLECKLVVVGVDKRIEYQDKIISGIQNPLPSSFFLWKNFLIYIKNRSEFVSYLL